LTVLPAQFEHCVIDAIAGPQSVGIAQLVADDVVRIGAIHT
jgi:hypothetical protein